jgi:NAD(P)-dependent dehydrogenase (short-subunit alcohol dehydrogenase family)
MALDGKVVIITGAGRGIGRAVATELARAGATVVIGARSEADLNAVRDAIVAAGGHAVAVAGDIAEPDTAERLVAVADQFGACDILINAAAVQDVVGEVETIPIEGWVRTIAINLTGTFLGCRAVLSRMKQRRRGRILNVASGLADRVQPGQAPYSASKAAVVQFTRVLAAEVEPFGITANAIHPGIVRTRMVEHLLGLETNGVRGEIVERMSELERSRAIIEPEEAARFFLWASITDVGTGKFLRWDDSAARAEMERRACGRDKPNVGLPSYSEPGVALAMRAPGASRQCCTIFRAALLHRGDSVGYLVDHVLPAARPGGASPSDQSSWAAGRIASSAPWSHGASSPSAARGCRSTKIAGLGHDAHLPGMAGRGLAGVMTRARDVIGARQRG